LLRLSVVAARAACCEELDMAASTFIGSIDIVGEESCVSMNQSCRLEELNPPPKTLDLNKWLCISFRKASQDRRVQKEGKHQAGLGAAEQR